MALAADIIFYGLLVIDSDNTVYPNLKSAARAVDTYIKCGALMCISARRVGVRAVLVTNERARVVDALQRLGIMDVDVLEMQFHNALPKGIPHRAAHNKLALISELATGVYGEYVGIVDLDVVFLNTLSLPRSLDAETIYSYDITDQMSAESEGRALQDLLLIVSDPIKSPRWFGGELLFGHHKMLSLLSQDVTRIFPIYCKLIHQIYHIGDEFVVSGAINTLSNRGVKIYDVGSDGFIKRWWTLRRPFPQSRLGDIMFSAILHFPGDKEFLATQATPNFDSRIFLSRYRLYAAVRLTIRHLYTWVEMGITTKRRHYVARL